MYSPAGSVGGRNGVEVGYQEGGSGGSEVMERVGGGGERGGRIEIRPITYSPQSS